MRSSTVRVLSFVSGLGMMVASIMTMQHFFAANYPVSIFEGSFCDISAFFNCDSSAYSSIAQIAGVPLGYFGVMVGGLMALGAMFPSQAFERTNKTIAALNVVGVIALAGYSVLVLGSLCLLCAGYYLFATLSFLLFWRFGLDREEVTVWKRFFRPSPMHMAAFAGVTIAGAYGVDLFHQAKKDAQSGGVAARIVNQYYSLPEVAWPSVISPFWTAKATERFEDAPIQVVEFGDYLCPDCLYLQEQLLRLKEEFSGQLNIAFQFFPLDAQCNNVVDKDKHPGACDLSYMAAYDPDKFLMVHDEVFGNLRAARSAEWRTEFAERHQLTAALTDSATKALVHTLIQTGAEYDKTSDQYAHGIRSTPTMIINKRMIIGTFPYEQLRAIFQALVDEYEATTGERRFIENWMETG